VEALSAIALDESEKSADRIRAIQELFDRGWGKAPAFAPIEDGDPLELSDIDRAIGKLIDERAAEIADERAGVDELAARREAQNA